MTAIPPKGDELQRLELSVSGLPDGPAAAPVTARLRGVAGVCQLIANPITERAVILFDPAVIGIDGIIQAFNAEGLDVDRTLAHWHLRVAGRTDVEAVWTALLVQGFDPGPSPRSGSAAV